VIAAAAGLVLAPRRPTSTDVPFSASGVSLQTYTDAGDLSWEVFAREGEVDGQEASLRDVEVRFYGASEESLVTTADRLTRGDGESVLAGRVRVDRGDGLRLETEELAWDESAEILKTSAIELRIRDLALTGERFQYALRLDRATIDGGVVATVATEGITMRAAAAEEIDDRTVRLAGGVEASFPDGTLTAERAEVTDEGVGASGTVSLHLNLATGEDRDVP